ncbi:hypothetical protein B0H14DRAFT_2594426 [Mycena olivaceomarginata]|nr:hypothetical protein B0H14DRAFT_2594426 [Mycena olivaceomarginata]
MFRACYAARKGGGVVESSENEICDDQNGNGRAAENPEGQPKVQIPSFFPVHFGEIFNAPDPGMDRALELRKERKQRKRQRKAELDAASATGSTVPEILDMQEASMSIGVLYPTSGRGHRDALGARAARATAPGTDSAPRYFCWTPCQSQAADLETPAAAAPSTTTIRGNYSLRT